MITPQSLVQAGLYPDEQTVIQEALRVLWQERPHLRVEWAIYQYQTQLISLAKAASIAGISFEQFKERLLQRGIQPRLGAESIGEAQEELEIISVCY